MEYTNTDGQERYWPTLQGADGTTVGLLPGETVELPDGVTVEDPYLRPTAATKRSGRGKGPKAGPEADVGPESGPDNGADTTDDEPAAGTPSGKEN
jgi:hypothetical protein